MPQYEPLQDTKDCMDCLKHTEAGNGGEYVTGMSETCGCTTDPFYQQPRKVLYAWTWELDPLPPGWNMTEPLPVEWRIHAGVPAPTPGPQNGTTPEGTRVPKRVFFWLLV